MTSSEGYPLIGDEEIREHIKQHYPSCMHELTNIFSVNIAEKDAVWIYLEELRDHICKLYSSYDNLVKERDELKDSLKHRQHLYRNLRQNIASTTTHVQESLYSLNMLAQPEKNDDAPEIKDIINPDGPQRIGERFSEIYDREWKDAFEVLKKIQGRNNEVLEIQELLNTTELCYELCFTKASKQLREIESSLSFVNEEKLTPQMYIQTTTFRRTIAGETVKIIQKEFAAVPGVVDIEVPELKKFVDACLNCFWLAAIQYPPLSLDFDDKASMLYDPAENRPYNNVDRYISYRVWPSMRMYKGGPLLAKGIVQCCSERGGQFKDEHIHMIHGKQTKPR